MAFISQDWRDPGNFYVKSDLGHWEPTKLYRIRIFETLTENFIKRTFRQSVSEIECGNYSHGNNLHEMFQNKNLCGFYQPHIIIKQISTKEESLIYILQIMFLIFQSAVLTSLSEAILALDFKVAIRDIRRFGYICRVLKIFITEKFPYLSGRTQLYIIELLKEILRQVSITQNNMNILRKLLQNLESALEKGKYYHVGSFQLWKNHLSAVETMNISLNNLDFKKDNTSDKLSLENLPPECLIQILNHITCPQDLEMTAQSCFALQNLVNDELLWKNLVVIHFTSDQIQSINYTHQRSNTDDYWKHVYSKLLYKFGDGHYFPLKLGKCFKCYCVFWPIFGHPCTSESNELNYKSLLPEDFVGLFDI